MVSTVAPPKPLPLKRLPARRHRPSGGARPRSPIALVCSVTAQPQRQAAHNSLQSSLRSFLAFLAQHQQMSSLLAGGVAGAIAACVTNPVEVVKTKLQGSSQLRILDVVSQVMRVEGIRGFFRGLPPTLIGILPARSTYFWAYETTKDLASQLAGDSALVYILSAAAAGIVSNTVTNPIWMIKTRVQLSAGDASVAAYAGYRDAMRRILREEGVQGFFKGLSAAYWGVAEGAIHWVIYERLKKTLIARQLEHDRLQRRVDDKADAGGAPPALRRSRGAAPADGQPPKFELFCAAAAAKLIASASTYPHEVVRTRMRIAPPFGQPSRYRTVVQSLRLIGREEGLRGLYSGMGTHLLRCVPNAALMFVVYESVTSWLERNAQDMHAQRAATPKEIEQEEDEAVMAVAPE